MKRSQISYRKAGVDVLGARGFVETIKPLALLTRRPGLLKGIGGFGGLFELAASGAGKRPVLAASADGVGTKLKLAQIAGWYEPLGVDLVAMNVNDILCVGARPLFFLDYIAAGRLRTRVFTDVVRGVVRGCVESGCVLLGGETAQMPLLYRGGDFDLAGFAVGVVDKGDVMSGEKVRAGQVVLGLASNGPHANGFTLIQRVLSKPELKRNARELLKPTRIYVRPVLELLKKNCPVTGIAHITGGSFAEKLPRVLPPGLAVRLTKRSWPIPAIFGKIQAAGVPEAEMYRTFNMGVGMAVIVPARAVSKTRKVLSRSGLSSWPIGQVTRGKQEVLWT
ncbi:MAG: phosphoribosylformylglycinamidine cyclo-ligase [Candidatus Omnitrophica bacterium]|nr:phosphoribosylformylglycinamidine cyclo-ligase [Candidatus Omnitrophota bacterium]